MRLNEDQETQVYKIESRVSEIAKIQNRHRLAMVMDTAELRRELLNEIREAHESGVPKRQIQRATGVKGTAAFYELLRDAGVTIEKKPQSLVGDFGLVRQPKRESADLNLGRGNG